MKLVLINELSRKMYTLEISEETTAKEIVDLLIGDGSIKPAPREGCRWVLRDSRGVAFTPNEKMSSRFPQGSREYEVFYEVHLVSQPIATKLIVRDKVSEKRYELEIFEENTAKDVIIALIEEGLIKPIPIEGCQWVLTDSEGSRIIPDEELSSRLSPGENKVYLSTRTVGDVKTRKI